MAKIKFTFEDLNVYEKALDFIDITYSLFSKSLNMKSMVILSI